MTVFQDHSALREKNLEAAKTYLSMKHMERLERWRCYSEYVRPMMDLRPPEQQKEPATALEIQKAAEYFNAQNFPDWQFDNNVYFMTEDPNVIMVEGDGFGQFGDGSGAHREHYLHYFRFFDGKILRYREIGNGLHEMVERGIDVNAPDLGPLLQPFSAQNARLTCYQATGVNNDQARQANRETIWNYMGLSGREAEQRAELYAPDCSFGLIHSHDALTRYAKGIKQVTQVEKMLAACFPDAYYEDIVVFQTEDPDYFLVTANGSGTCTGVTEAPFSVAMPLYYLFRMHQGKIVENHLLAAPEHLLRAMGWKNPMDLMMEREREQG